ncbi:hypothetical protein [Mesorhizobium sp.]|uniref:hypothetical protein n=1 Tax=Mesorhizobium sp. TaxID=1871066 RepID=UPI0025BE5D46|nr:hypothetical protein [Mesorhizobium sp.]
MTSAALVRQEKYQIGRVFNNTFSVIGRNIVLCVGLAALFSGLPQLVTQLVRLNPHPGNPANFAAAITNHKLGFIVGIAVIVILYLVLAVLLQSSLVRVAIEDMNGKKPTFGDSIATAIRFLLPTVAIGLLVALGVGAASIALLVPGIILGLGWSVAIPVLIQERLGVFGSMSRSRALTKGSRWALFGLFVILARDSIHNRSGRLSIPWHRRRRRGRHGPEHRLDGGFRRSRRQLCRTAPGQGRHRRR